MAQPMLPTFTTPLAMACRSVLEPAGQPRSPPSRRYRPQALPRQDFSPSYYAPCCRRHGRRSAAWAKCSPAIEAVTACLVQGQATAGDSLQPLGRIRVLCWAAADSQAPAAAAVEDLSFRTKSAAAPGLPLPGGLLMLHPGSLRWQSGTRMAPALQRPPALQPGPRSLGRAPPRQPEQPPALAGTQARRCRPAPHHSTELAQQVHPRMAACCPQYSGRQADHTGCWPSRRWQLRGTLQPRPCSGRGSTPGSSPGGGRQPCSCRQAPHGSSLASGARLLTEPCACAAPRAVGPARREREPGAGAQTGPWPAAWAQGAASGAGALVDTLR